MVSSKPKKLEEILIGIEGKILLIDHEFSDPDSIASKYAWGFILREKFGKEYDIGYANEIGHHKTQSLAKRFDAFYPQQKKIQEIILDEYEAIMILDVNLSSNNLPFTEVQQSNLAYEKIIIIDHHEKNNTDSHNIKFEDIIETGISSTAAITIEYLKAYGLEFKVDNEEHSLLATALWLGMETDLRGNLPLKRDLEAQKYISEKANYLLKSEIERGARPEGAQRALGKALSNSKKIGTSFTIGYVGEINANQKDIIAIAAEELLKTQGVEGTVAWGMVDRVPIGSIRTERSSSYNAMNIAKIFGGGGRPNAGGFQGDFGILHDYDDQDKDTIITLTSKMIERRINKEIGSD